MLNVFREVNFPYEGESFIVSCKLSKIVNY
jgi:hypothetical protein